MHGSVQVNLIFNPTMFGTKRRNNALPGQYDTDKDEGKEDPLPTRGISKQRQGPPCHSFFQSMVIEKQWKHS